MDTFSGWMSRPLSLNKYIYAHASPTYYTDPTGRFVSIGGFSAGQTAMAILATASVATYQIGQSLATAPSPDEGFNDRQLGWLVLAGMSAAGSRVFDIVRGKLDDRNDPTVDLYRAVDEGEYFDIVSCDCFRPSRSGEPKRFWINDINAAYVFGNRILGDPNDWAVVGATVSEPFFKSLDHTSMDTFIGQTVTVHPPILPAFNFEVNRNGGIRYH